MARAVPAWVGANDDTAVPKRVKIRVWDREQGKCHRCARKIPVGDAWIIEHRLALILGGPNAEQNLCLSCSWCKTAKDAEDVAAKADTARVRSKHLGVATRHMGLSQPGSLPGARIKYSRARGVWIDRTTGQIVEPTP